MKAQRGKQRYSSVLSLTLAFDGDRWSKSHTGSFTSRKDTWYPLWTLDAPQGQSEREWKISPPPGFNTQTVQPVASRYTD